MLRKTIIAKIHSALDKSAFSIADFDVDFPENGEVLASIKFRYKAEFFFRIQEVWDEQLGGAKFFAVEAPGEHKIKEGIPLTALSDVPARVSAWCSNIRSELRASMPVYEDLDQLRELIEEHIREHVPNPEEPFSEDEVQSLKEKFEELAEKLDELQQKNELTEQEVNRLKREIGGIKSDLSGYPKGIWYRTAANKVFSTLNKIAVSKEGKNVLASAARKLLGLDDGHI